MLRIDGWPAISSAPSRSNCRLVDVGLVAHHPGQRPRHLGMGVQRPLQIRARSPSRSCASARALWRKASRLRSS